MDDLRRRSVDGGWSVIVGTADADGVPVTCRGVALSANDDFSLLTVYIPVATGQETIANIATTRRIAVGATYPLDHASIQYKGTTRGVRLAKDEEAGLIDRRMEQFAEVLDAIGVPRLMTLSLSRWPAFAVDVNVEEIFDQTPGPKAGQTLR